MALSPGQKKLLMYGVPIVAALALFVILRKKTPASTAVASGTTSGGDTAVGLGQLASFENAVQGQLAQLAGMITAGTTSVAPPPNATPSTPTPSGQMSVAGKTYNYISSPSTGSVLAAAGQTVYAIEAGVAVPVVVNDQWTAAGKALPTGSKLYVGA